MIEQVYSFDSLMERWHVAGVTAIGVTPGLVGRCGELFAAYFLTVGSSPSGSVLYVVYLA